MDLRHPAYNAKANRTEPERSDPLLRAAAFELRRMADDVAHLDHHGAAAVLRFGVAMRVTCADAYTRGPLGSCSLNAFVHAATTDQFYIEGFASPDAQPVVWHCWTARDPDRAIDVTWPYSVDRPPYIGLPIRTPTLTDSGVQTLPHVDRHTDWADVIHPVLDQWRTQAHLPATGLWT
jgi:hypothetical protein